MNWRALHGDYFEGTRVLITGGAGFIGSHLAEALVSLGASVIVLDDLSGGQRDNLAPFAPVDFVEGSVLDPDLLNYCTRGCRCGARHTERDCRAARELQSVLYGIPRFGPEAR